MSSIISYVTGSVMESRDKDQINVKNNLQTSESTSALHLTL